MFLTRLLSGIVLIVIIAAMNIPGGPFMELLLVVISLAGLREFYRAVGVSKGAGKMNILELTGIAGTIFYYGAALLEYLRNSGLPDSERRLTEGLIPLDTLFMAVIVVFLVMMAEYVFCFPTIEGRTVMNAFFGFIYVPVMLSFIFLVRCMNNGQFLVWLIYIVSWVCDTSAYCVGMLFGRHKLAPVLSPKKSIEGAVGGVAGSAVVSWIFALILVNTLHIPGELIWLFIIAGALGSVVSQTGDLAASAFKRNYDIKDYGSLIPGHGGILDRFDSVIFAAPVIYILVELIGRLR